jgi:hypothetical protein
MYEVLTNKQYRKLTAEDQIVELKKWLSDQLDNHCAVMRSVSGTLIEADPEIEEAIGADLNELPTMINDYEEGTAANFIVKYRLANAIEDCDDSILDTDEFGKVVMKLLSNSEYESEEDINIIRSHKSFCSDMITVCLIFGYEDLRKSFIAWHPNL